MAETIKIKCLKLVQPIGEFYIGVISYKDLREIAYADTRTMESGEEEDQYLGIQRPLSIPRVEEIKKYVNTVDAAFPTGITVHITSDKIISYDEKNSEIEILKEPDVARIIDGQHRIAGLKGFKGENFDINLVIFIDMDIEEQAIMFSTINLKQTKVNKSIVYDLYEYNTNRSPQKTCHNVAKTLNKTDGPFKNRIKILGTAIYKDEIITQARFVEELMKMISEDPNNDRDIIKRAQKYQDAQIALKKVVNKKPQELIFREYFINNQDDKISYILYTYFLAVQNLWPNSWNFIKANNILNKTTGFIALMEFLRNVYKYKNMGYGKIIEVNDYVTIFNKTGLKDGDFTKDRYLLGTGGQRQLLNDLMRGLK
jgi:DGQHR domain-containing protein